MWTASVRWIVSMPITSIVAPPTLNTPYLALNVSRSPIGNVITGAGLIAGSTATAAPAALFDEPAATPVHTESWATRGGAFPAARSASTITAEPLRAALMSARDRHTPRAAVATVCRGTDVA